MSTVSNTESSRTQKSDSIANLTKPQLFSLYDEDITEPTESNSLYSMLKRKASANREVQVVQHTTILQKLANFMYAIVVLSISGILYFEISKNLHDNHALHPSFTSKPAIVIVKLIKLVFGDELPPILENEFVIYSIEGVLFGAIIPTLDLIFLQKQKVQEIHNDTTFFSLLRIINAMLGVTFGIRKLQWSSSLQAAGVWGLLNIILWLFFDGSISLLFESLIASVGVILGCVYEFGDDWEFSQFLYLADFYFLGFIIFGKVGRFLLF